jgi:peptide/nickel transport system ATP-binding protein
MSVLQVSDLSIALPRGGDRPKAVDGVSFQIERNEILCLVGESGSGKSVIAQAIMGLLPKTLSVAGGKILLEGEELTTCSAARLRALRGARMAMIFQEPMTALNPVMSCGAQIDEVFQSHASSMGKAERRGKAIDILREVSIAEPERILAAYPHQLSGGQRQRVMIAMALALEPALLIADEPTTALDVTTQAQILKLIVQIQEKHGMGVLFITHDFGVVAEIAQRVAVLRAGEVVETGAKDAVLKRPRHEYTKMLIRSVPTLKPHSRVTEQSALVLETRNLCKTYSTGSWLGARREVRAAEDVSLEVRKGQTLGIVGESGSGKSTVARCIVRLIEPSAGEVRLGGTDLARMPQRRLRALRRRVQIVFQDPYRSLNPRRTVGEAIIEGPMNYGLPRPAALARARSLMELVRMDPQALGRYPHQFSGGQRQRICIARALAVEPDLLVADEAVSALDVSVQAQVLALLVDLQRRYGMSYLFISHDLAVVRAVSHRVMVMKDGGIVEEGEAEALFAAPRHPYTQALLAAAHLAA